MGQMEPLKVKSRLCHKLVDHHKEGITFNLRQSLLVMVVVNEENRGES